MAARPWIDPHRRHLILGALALGLIGPGRLAAQGLGSDGQPIVADPEIEALADQVDANRLRGTVAALSSFPTRWTEAATYPDVENWLYDALEAAGAAPGDVWRHKFRMPSGSERHNIVSGRPQAGRGAILVGAHLDSISERPADLAPGANDNATGIAAILEAQRILAPVPLRADLIFAGFGGEEQGLIGSDALAETARVGGWPLALMLNLDMLGARPDQPGAPFYVEYDWGNRVATNDAQARGYGLMAAHLARAHTTLEIAHTDIWDSDYMGFEAIGVPCIGFYDGGAESPSYHTSQDTIDTVDFDRLEQAARLVVATLAKAAKIVR